MQLKCIPMCSPKLLSKGRRLDRVEDLEHFTLLREEGSNAWPVWFAASGIPQTWSQRSIVLDNYAVLLQAAIECQGVALLMYPMFTDHLAKKRLGIPLGTSGYVWMTYYLLCRRRADTDSSVVAEFRNWIFEEVRRDRRLKSGIDRSNQVQQISYLS
jgi:LysR family glycine cleavage system transcriptional activator